MHLFPTIRGLILTGIVFTMPLCAQTPQQPQLSNPQQSPQTAQVTYHSGQLTVSAHNSSLNEILRDISRHTGMKITGGVPDERVYGQYGPAAPSQVLARLLDGAGSNMLLLQATANSPAELILTPRSGPPTPPDPNAAAREAAMETSRPAYPAYRPEYPPASHPEANAPANPAQSGASPSQPTANRPQPTGQSGTQPGAQPSNAPRTPQQIYEELQRLRQQRQQQRLQP